jgi:parallel beta-helix repeat protein
VGRHSDCAPFADDASDGSAVSDVDSTGSLAASAGPSHAALRYRHRRPTRRGRVIKPLVLVSAASMAIAGTVVSVLLSGGHSGGASTPPYSTTIRNVYDQMGRTTSNGLGSAQVGGAYSVWPANSFSVSGSAAHIAGLKPANSVRAYLPSVRNADQQLQAIFDVRQLAKAGNGSYLALEIRRQANGDAYRARVRIDPAGRLGLSISKVRNGVESYLGIEHLLPNRVSVGQHINLQALVVGADPATIEARATVSGVPMPNWQASESDSTPGSLAEPGNVGVWAYQSASSDPTTFDMTDLEGWALAPAVATAQPVPSPTRTTAATGSSRPGLAPRVASSAKPSPSASVPPPSASSTATPPSTSTHPSAPTTSSSSASTPSQPAGGATEPSAAQGSVAVGASDYAVPSDAVVVAPTGNDSAAGTLSAPLHTIQAAISRAASGQTIVIRAGDYHEQLFIAADKRLTIQPYPHEAVWLDGSTPVTGWTQQGTRWVHTGWTSQFDTSASFSSGSNAGGFVSASYPMAAHPDQLMVDGTQLTQVASAAQVGAGQFAVDYTAHTITMGTNPAGHAVRASDLQKAIVSAGAVTLRGFGVHYYATSLPMMGTIYLGGSAGASTLQNLVVADNATQGVSVDTAGVTLDHVTAMNNGMTGIHANQADNLAIVNSLVSQNNSQHFNTEPSAAGVKVTQLRGVRFIGNMVTNNGARGFWTDQSVVGITMADNTFSGNYMATMLELSDTGVVANNTFADGRQGLYILDTGNIKVYNNAFSGQTVAGLYVSQDERRESNASIAAHDPRQPIPDPTCPWLVRNITVDNNVFLQPGSGESFQFYALDGQTNIPADSMNIVLQGNIFRPRTVASDPWSIGWGAADNHTLAMYATPSAFSLAKSKTWLNGVSTGLTLDSVVTGAGSIGQPLPADVATAVGVAAGTVQVGPF